MFPGTLETAVPSSQSVLSPHIKLKLLWRDGIGSNTTHESLGRRHHLSINRVKSLERPWRLNPTFEKRMAVVLNAEWGKIEIRNGYTAEPVFMQHRKITFKGGTECAGISSGDVAVVYTLSDRSGERASSEILGRSRYSALLSPEPLFFPLK